MVNSNRSSKKRENGRIADEFKDACPEHRLKDLDRLVKDHKGDREKIREQVSEWWNETPPVEEKWEDVNSKKGGKRVHHYNNQGGGHYRDRDGGGSGGSGGSGGGYHGGHERYGNNNHSGGGGGGGHHKRGGRGGSRSHGGRGGHGRYVAGGRGNGRDRDRDRDRGGRYSNDRRENGKEGVDGKSENSNSNGNDKEDNEMQREEIKGPTPGRRERPLQGAWGQRAVPSNGADDAIGDASPDNTPAVVGDTKSTAVLQPITSDENEAYPSSAHISPDQDDSNVNTPAPTEVTTNSTEFAAEVGVSDPIQNQVTPPHSPPPSSSHTLPPAPTGNVWATRGSAHLIQAEKPKPSQPRQKHNQQHQQNVEDSSSISATALTIEPSPSDGQSDVVISEQKQTTSASSTTTIEDLIGVTTSKTVDTVAATTSKTSSSSATTKDNDDNGLSASVNGANINAAGWKPHSTNSSNTNKKPQDTITEDSVIDTTTQLLNLSSEGKQQQQQQQQAEDDAIVNTEISSNEPSTVAAVVASVAVEPVLKSSNVLNMAHWAPGEGEDSQNVDFAFGSYGVGGDDVGSVEDTSAIVSNATTGSSLVPNNTATEAVNAVTERGGGNGGGGVGSTISPARPPPGLGLGMPPMPEEIVSVHDLENKLESSASLKTNKAKKEDHHHRPHGRHSSSGDNSMDGGGGTGNNGSTSVAAGRQDKTISSKTLSTTTGGGGVSTTPANVTGIANTIPGTEGFMPIPPTVISQYTTGYGMGMYGYAAQNHNGFMGVHSPAGPGLSGGVGGAAGAAALPKQQQQQQHSGADQQSSGAAGLGGSSSLYGNTTSTESQSSVIAGQGAGGSGNDSANPAAGMPPGMPAGMPYNPAVFYGQQPYQMAGQPHGVGYGYGYGQFGGVQAGGFAAYQQVMGQNPGAGGYGQPYDDPSSHQHHGGGGGHGHGGHSGGGNNNPQGGGYGKSGGGGGHNYRGGGGGGGRNSHNHNQNHHGNHNHHNQYQTGYNPQATGHGGYSGVPAYNMGYDNHIHPSRGGGGYGPAMDYNMATNSYQSSGFSNHDDGNQLGANSGGGGGGGKGKSKGNNRANGSGHNNDGNTFSNPGGMHQYPGSQVGGGPQQQNFLQSGAAVTDSTSGAGGGLGYQSWSGGGL